jgi:hypothetical protein
LDRINKEEQIIKCSICEWEAISIQQDKKLGSYNNITLIEAKVTVD